MSPRHLLEQRNHFLASHVEPFRLGPTRQHPVLFRFAQVEEPFDVRTVDETRRRRHDLVGAVRAEPVQRKGRGAWYKYAGLFFLDCTRLERSGNARFLIETADRFKHRPQIAFESRQDSTRLGVDFGDDANRARCRRVDELGLHVRRRRRRGRDALGAAPKG